MTDTVLTRDVKLLHEDLYIYPTYILSNSSLSFLYLTLHLLYTCYTALGPIGNICPWHPNSNKVIKSNQVQNSAQSNYCQCARDEHWLLH